jgi:hypothetical protein
LTASKWNGGDKTFRYCLEIIKISYFYVNSGY